MAIVPLPFQERVALEAPSLITVRGSVCSNPHRFNVTLLSDEKAYPTENTDRSFHLCVRFDKDTIIFNTQTKGKWEKEEVIRGVKPFARDCQFEITLFVTPTHYEMSVNGRFFYIFRQREPHHHSSVRSLGVRDEPLAASGPGLVVTFISVEACFKEGNVVQFQPKAFSGGFLRLRDDGGIDCRGGFGKRTQFKVVSRGQGIFALQSVKNTKRFLAIRDGELRFGQGGKFCDFKVVEPSAHSLFVCLESVSHPGQHIGVLPTGEIKPPQHTKTGDHGQFFVRLVDPPTKRHSLGSPGGMPVGVEASPY